MKEIYYQTKSFLIPGVVGIVCIIILALVIYPQVADYFKERDNITTLQNRITTLDNKTKELQGIDEAAMKKDLAVALTILPTDRDVPKAMSALQDLIKKSNLVLDSTGYSPGAKDQGKSNFMFTVTVIGSLPSLRNFMNELQSGSNIYRIESIDLTFQEKSSLATVSIPLTTFYESSPKIQMTLDQPVSVINDKDKELIAKLTKIVNDLNAAPVSTSAAVPLGKIDPFQ